MDMSLPEMEFERAALMWLTRVNEPGFEGWEAWDQWMAADPRHAETYWRLAEAEADVVEALRAAPLRPGVRPALRPALRMRSVTGFPRRRAIAAAVAVLAVGMGWVAWSGRSQPVVFETAPGQSREMTLADGSVVSMAGGTRLTFDRRRPRDVDLERGRALFAVVHDEAHPFRVDVDGTTLTDLGTTFDVTRLAAGVRVAVSEGVVRVDRSGASATLRAGDGVLASARGLERRPVPPQDVAGWRDGRLSYEHERLSVVAEDLSRAFNRPVTVAEAISDRRFSGSLATTASPEEARARLAKLLGVSIVPVGEGWRLEPDPGS
jgi:transmembrane sensor